MQGGVNDHSVIDLAFLVDNQMDELLIVFRLPESVIQLSLGVGNGIAKFYSSNGKQLRSEVKIGARSLLHDQCRICLKLRTSVKPWRLGGGEKNTGMYIH